MSEGWGCTSECYLRHLKFGELSLAVCDGPSSETAIEQGKQNVHKCHWSCLLVIGRLITNGRNRLEGDWPSIGYPVPIRLCLLTVTSPPFYAAAMQDKSSFVFCLHSCIVCRYRKVQLLCRLLTLSRLLWPRPNWLPAGYYYSRLFLHV